MSVCMRVCVCVCVCVHACMRACVCVSPVQLGDGVGRCLPHVRGHVHDGLLDGQHHDGHYHWHADTRQHSQCTGTDQLVRVLQTVGFVVAVRTSTSII